VELIETCCGSSFGKRFLPRPFNHLPGIGFDEVTVREDNALEIPLQDTLQRGARGFLVAPA